MTHNTDYEAAAHNDRFTITGGDWHTSDIHASINQLEIIGNDVPVAIVPLDLYETDDLGQINQALANAAAIAAIPKLLAALENLTDLARYHLEPSHTEAHGDYMDALEQADRALEAANTVPEVRRDQLRHSPDHGCSASIPTDNPLPKKPPSM